jgi:CheY-like chemotaxis protein
MDQVPVGSRTILVVDDSASIRTLFEITLTDAGYTVITAMSGADALEACAAQRPTVAIVDIFLPAHDGERAERSGGLDLIRALRRSLYTPRIIAITGGGSDEPFDVLVSAKDVGADVTLRKPIPPSLLVEAVHLLCRAP